MNKENEQAQEHYETAEGQNEKRYYFTQIEDPILEDGIHLNAVDKAVYSVLMKYTYKGNKVAFPSQTVIAQMLGIKDRKTVRKSTEWMEHLNIIKTRKRLKPDGSLDSIEYRFPEIPEKIIEAAVLSRDIFKAKIVKEKREEAIKERKAFENRKKESKEEVEVKEQSLREEAKTTTKKKKYEFSVSEKTLFEIRSIAVDLGNTYKLSNKDLEALDKEKKIDYVLSIHNGETKTKAKTSASYLKAYFMYVKKFGVPSSEVEGKLGNYLSKYAPKIITEAIKLAKKENINLTSEKFSKMVIEAEKKELATSKAWKKANYESSGKSDYQKEIIVENVSVSDYSNDEDLDFFNALNEFSE